MVAYFLLKVDFWVTITDRGGKIILTVKKIIKKKSFSIPKSGVLGIIPALHATFGNKTFGAEK